VTATLAPLTPAQQNALLLGRQLRLALGRAMVLCEEIQSTKVSFPGNREAQSLWNLFRRHAPGISWCLRFPEDLLAGDLFPSVIEADDAADEQGADLPLLTPDLGC